MSNDSPLTPIIPRYHNLDHRTAATLLVHADDGELHHLRRVTTAEVLDLMAVAAASARDLLGEVDDPIDPDPYNDPVWGRIDALCEFAGWCSEVASEAITDGRFTLGNKSKVISASTFVDLD